MKRENDRARLVEPREAGRAGRAFGVRRTLAGAGFAFAVACVVAPSADAAFVASLVGRTEGRTETCGHSTQLAWDSPGSVTMLARGAFQHDFEDEEGTPFQSWALELGPALDGGAMYLFEQRTLGSAGLGGMRATLLSDLFARWIDPATNRVVGPHASRATISAAFQLVVWEIAHENLDTADAAVARGRMTLGLGAFKASASAATASAFTEIVDSLGAGGFLGSGLEVLANPVAQDQIRAVPSPGAAFALLAAFAAPARRRRR
jgi:hypothetical protein